MQQSIIFFASKSFIQKKAQITLNSFSVNQLGLEPRTNLAEQ